MYNIKIRTNTFCALILNQNIKRKKYYVAFKKSSVAVRKMDTNRYFIKVTGCLSVCSEGTRPPKKLEMYGRNSFD